MSLAVFLALAERTDILMLLLIGCVDETDLLVECPEVVNIAYAKQTTGAEINQAGNPLSHIHSVDTEQAKKSQQ